MRTKTLLIAAAALAATVISSQAQVYSGVVGYVSVVSSANAFTAIANPVDLDGVDNITNVLKNVPNGSSVQIWNGGGFTLVTKALFGGAWSANAATNFLPPGVGFFLKTPSTQTNTFVGTVGSGVYPGTNSLALPANTYVFIGSPIPFSGSLTDAYASDALNLGATLPKGSSIQVWNGAGYTLSTKGLFNGIWSTNLTINPGQSVFVKSVSATNLVQTLQ